MKQLLEYNQELSIQLFDECKKDSKNLQLDVVEILLENGANPNYMDENGETCLYWACRRLVSGSDLYRLLLKHKANPNIGKNCLDGYLSLYALENDGWNRIPLNFDLVETMCGKLADFEKILGKHHEVILDNATSKYSLLSDKTGILTVLNAVAMGYDIYYSYDLLPCNLQRPAGKMRALFKLCPPNKLPVLLELFKEIWDKGLGVTKAYPWLPESSKKEIMMGLMFFKRLNTINKNYCPRVIQYKIFNHMIEEYSGIEGIKNILEKIYINEKFQTAISSDIHIEEKIKKQNPEEFFNDLFNNSRATSTLNVCPN